MVGAALMPPLVDWGRPDCTKELAGAWEECDEEEVLGRNEEGA